MDFQDKKKICIFKNITFCAVKFFSLRCFLFSDVDVRLRPYFGAISWFLCGVLVIRAPNMHAHHKRKSRASRQSNPATAEAFFVAMSKRSSFWNTVFETMAPGILQHLFWSNPFFRLPRQRQQLLIDSRMRFSVSFNGTASSRESGQASV